MKFRMFHVPKPKQYGYKPQFYVPDDEEPEYKKQSKNASKSDAGGYWQKETERLKRRKPINITIYLVIILILLYLIFFS
ncbi:MAG: hypothetical protein CVU11_15935 [Bacteroidetes bacterium HGW-Bacteroidetes-6]|jgi:hypothetical protein|nr:MAG: hypothetical protein CVU11_15935 [Bacteroidetes bacterium HGW-Bacteroidetes-6]